MPPDAHQDAAEATKRHRVRTLKAFEAFAKSRGFEAINEIDLEALNAFRTIRSVSARTWTKELGTIRHFFRHCLDNEWILRSWADKVPSRKI